MINLLADARKSSIIAARTNVIILRYIGIIILAFAFMLGALGVSYTLLESTMESAESLIASNSNKVSQEEASSNDNSAVIAQLNQAQAMMSQEVSYSQVLITLGQAMPAGAVLGELDLTETSFFGTPTTLTIYAQSDGDAESIQSALQGSPVFGSITLQDAQPSGGPAGYPATLTFNAVLNRVEG